MYSLKTHAMLPFASLLLTCLVSGAAFAATNPVLMRDVDRPAGINNRTFSCTDVSGAGCTWKPAGPAAGPAPLVINFVSYRIRFTSATKVTSVALFCGPPGGVDWLPLGVATDDGAGISTISWGGLVTLVYDTNCTGGVVYDHTGPNALSVDMRVHGRTEAPFP